MARCCDECHHEIELARAVARVRADGNEAVDDVVVWSITAAALEIELTPSIRRVAAELVPAGLRALDCIHVASALSLAGDLAAILTYDERMQRAAIMNRVEVLAPA